MTQTDCRCSWTHFDCRRARSMIERRSSSQRWGLVRIFGRVLTGDGYNELARLPTAMPFLRMTPFANHRSTETCAARVRQHITNIIDSSTCRDLACRVATCKGCAVGTTRSVIARMVDFPHPNPRLPTRPHFREENDFLTWLGTWSNSSHSPYYCRSRRRLASSGPWYPNVPAQRKRWRSTYVRSRGNVEDEVTVRFAVRAMRRSQDSSRMQLRSEKMVAHRAEKRKGTRPEKSVCDSKAKIARLGAVDPQFPTR